MTNRKFTIDVEPETQENAVFLGDKFICFEDDLDKQVEVLNTLLCEYDNTKRVLNDFMNILNQMQYYFREGTTIRDLDSKDLFTLVKLSHQARDMLQNMNMELKE